MGSQLTLHSHLRPEQCVQRLQDAYESCRESGESLCFRFTWQRWNGPEVWVTVSGNRFWLVVMGNMKNSFRPIFHGRIDENRGGAGCIIRGFFAHHLAVRVFSVVWTLFLAIGALHQLQITNSMAAAVVTLTLGIAPVAIGGISDVFTQHQRSKMIGYLEEKLHAKPAE